MRALLILAPVTAVAGNCATPVDVIVHELLQGGPVMPEGYARC